MTKDRRRLDVLIKKITPSNILLLTFHQQQQSMKDARKKTIFKELPSIWWETWSEVKRVRKLRGVSRKTLGMMAIKTSRFSSLPDTANNFYSSYVYFHPNQIHENIANFIYLGWGWEGVHCEQLTGNEKIIIFFISCCCCRLKVRKVSFHYVMYRWGRRKKNRNMFLTQIKFSHGKSEKLSCLSIDRWWGRNELL